MSQWENTGTFWQRGTNTKRRTTSGRGTHKVFKSRAKEIERAAKARMKAEINELADTMLASNFGTRTQFKMGANGQLIRLNIPSYEEYTPELREHLAAMGIPNRQRRGPTGMERSYNGTNNNISMAMGSLSVGKGRKSRRRHTKRLRHTKRRYTRRN